MSASMAEKLRKFERLCLRVYSYRSSKSDYKHMISNYDLYNIAQIPRIDCFTLKLTKDYFQQVSNLVSHRKRTPMGHFVPIFLWHILLPVEDSHRKRTPIDHLILIFLWPILLPVGNSNNMRRIFDQSIHVFLWIILLPVEDSNDKRTPISP